MFQPHETKPIQEWKPLNLTKTENFLSGFTKFRLFAVGSVLSLGGFIYGLTTLFSSSNPTITSSNNINTTPLWSNESFSMELTGKIDFQDIPLEFTSVLPDVVQSGIANSLGVPQQNIYTSLIIPTSESTTRFRNLQEESQSISMNWNTILTKNESMELLNLQSPVSMGELSIQITSYIQQSSFQSSLIDSIFERIPPDIPIFRESIKINTPIQVQGIPPLNPSPSSSPSPSPSSSPIPSQELSFMYLIL
jgi:hypothetical protein